MSIKKPAVQQRAADIAHETVRSAGGGGTGRSSECWRLLSPRVEPRVRDLKKLRGTSFGTGFPHEKKDEQKPKGDFHLY